MKCHEALYHLYPPHLVFMHPFLTERDQASMSGPRQFPRPSPGFTRVIADARPFSFGLWEWCNECVADTKGNSHGPHDNHTNRRTQTARLPRMARHQKRRKRLLDESRSRMAASRWQGLLPSIGRHADEWPNRPSPAINQHWRRKGGRVSARRVAKISMIKFCQCPLN